MTDERRRKLLEVMAMVQQDVENDAGDFDGKPFTGKTMAVYMGNHGAAIAAVAKAVQEILEDQKPSV